MVSERTIINRGAEEKKKQAEVEEKVMATLSEDEKAELKMHKVFEKEEVMQEFAKIRDIEGQRPGGGQLVIFDGFPRLIW